MCIVHQLLTWLVCTTWSKTSCFLWSEIHWKFLWNFQWISLHKNNFNLLTFVQQHLAWRSRELQITKDLGATNEIWAAVGLYLLPHLSRPTSPRLISKVRVKAHSYCRIGRFRAGAYGVENRWLCVLEKWNACANQLFESDHFLPIRWWHRGTSWNFEKNCNCSFVYKCSSFRCSCSLVNIT